MGLLSVAVVHDTIDVTICDPHVRPRKKVPLTNADGTPMTITMAGPYSDTYKKLMHERQTLRLKAAQEAGGDLDFSAKMFEVEQNALLRGCRVGWNISITDKPEPFTPESVEKLMTNKNLAWVKDQIDVAFGSTRDFLGKPKAD